MWKVNSAKLLRKAVVGYFSGYPDCWVIQNQIFYNGQPPNKRIQSHCLADNLFYKPGYPMNAKIAE